MLSTITLFLLCYYYSCISHNLILVDIVATSSPYCELTVSIDRVRVSVLNMWIDSHVPLAHVKHEGERRLMMCAELEKQQETTFDFLLTMNRRRIKVDAFVAQFRDAQPASSSKKRFPSSGSFDKRK